MPRSQPNKDPPEEKKHAKLRKPPRKLIKRYSVDSEESKGHRKSKSLPSPLHKSKTQKRNKSNKKAKPSKLKLLHQKQKNESNDNSLSDFSESNKSDSPKKRTPTHSTYKKNNVNFYFCKANLIGRR